MEKRASLIKLKNDINTFFNVVIERPTRGLDEVYARMVYYKLYKNIDPAVTSTELANTVNRDHATILHSLKKFDTSYEYDKKFRYLYDSFMLRYPEYLREVYLREVQGQIKKDINDFVDFICELEVPERVSFLTQINEIKKTFIKNPQEHEGVL